VYKFDDKFAYEKNRINVLIHKIAADIQGKSVLYEDKLYNVVDYIIMGPGKRLRPLLMLAAYEAFEDNTDIGIMDVLDNMAVAIELIHCYSLVHDDLPAMDNDDYRRGRLSVHKKYDESFAILAGDALLNMSFELVLDAINGRLEHRIINAAKEIFNASGYFGMIRGQAMDMLLGQETSSNYILHTYINKTARLMMASTLCGGIIAGANESELNDMSEGAMYLGIAFQIKDDLLDMGKVDLDKFKDNSINYVSLCGLEKAKNDYDYYSKKALDVFSKHTSRSYFLYDLVDYIISRAY
jgi:geranylgeranyl diphosphate synthase type II